ncbi:hypothetical protein WJ071_000672 [Neisseria gonorrhoeae]
MPSEGFRRHRGPKRANRHSRHHGFVVRNRETGRKTLPPAPTPQPTKHPDSPARRLLRKP